MANPPLIFPLQEENWPRPFWSVMIPTYHPRANYFGDRCPLHNTCNAKDVATETKLLHALHALAGKLTMVVAAHRRGELRSTDRLG